MATHDLVPRIPAAACALLLLGLAAPAALAEGPDHAPEAPATVYEAAEMSPQNMDYDAASKTFPAHAGWLDDKLVHYYKFRMYTPMTYPTKVPMGGPVNIPVAPLYLLSKDGTYAGIPAGQKPILRHHTADGEDYSDFVRLVWVRVNDTYEANTWKSWHDLEDAGAELTPTDVIVNLPVVPMGSKLQHPVNRSEAAPIQPLHAWYKGAEVQTFVFETTDQAFADHFNPRTRAGDAAQAGSGFEITVSPYATPQRVSFAPIWHVNQYFTGVTPGVNSGGPAHMGQRNVIGVDRNDPGYSPLWQVIWVTKLPVGYRADGASHPDQFTEANGFATMPTPMFVNCPNVGPHGGGAMNPAKAASFQATPEVGAHPVTLEGALVMEAGKEVTLKVGERVVGNATSGMMGAWSAQVPASALGDGATTVTAVGPDGATVGTYTLRKAPEATPGPSTPPSTTPPPPTPGSGSNKGADAERATPAPAVLALGALGATALALRRRGA